MVTGFVLAGGKSSRMGRDKALLPVGSQTLIEVVIRRLRPFVDRVIVIGHAHNARQLRELPIETVLTDLKPHEGPLMGIFTGLMHTETPLNMFVPCDMPWIDGRLVARLTHACQEGAEVIASVHPLEGLQPFPLLCHVSACRLVGTLLDRGERSLQALLRQPRTQAVAIEDPGLWRSFMNVNTVADYAQLSDETTHAR